MKLLTIVFSTLIWAAVMPAQSSTPNPCSLLTRAEVQEAVGAPVLAGEIEKENQTVCTFKVGNTGSMVSIRILSREPGDNAEKQVAELKELKINAAVTSGFGDSAYTVKSQGAGPGLQELDAFKGAYHVGVSTFLKGAPEAKHVAVNQALMRKVLAKLR